MRDYPITRYEPRRLKKKRKERLIRLVILLSVVIVSIFFLFRTFERNKKETITTVDVLSISTTQQATDIPTQVPIGESLKEAVETALSGTTGTYGVFVKNLKTNETYALREHTAFEAGSLYKLWTMAVVYNKIQNGELTENEEIREKAEVLNDAFDIDTEFAEQKEGEVKFTVKDALQQMITISHNYAALLLIKKVRISGLETFLITNEFSESRVGKNGHTPFTTALDMVLFFEKLYNGELANPEYTQKMLTLLKSQQLNDKLPKYLPDDVTVAHKTGEIGWFTHDAGIVYSPNGDYIIAVLSKSNSPRDAKERIALVSKAVYEYFSK